MEHLIITIPQNHPTTDWSGLLPDILAEIAMHLQSAEDFMAFRGVCTSWRKSAPSKDHFFNSRPTIPLLMLGERYGTNTDDERQFNSLTKRKVVMRLFLPEAKGKVCLGARFGWLLTVDRDSGEITLLNPFSRATIPLPSPVYKHLSRPRSAFITKAVLSANPFHTSDFDLAVIHSGASFLGVWRSTGSEWTSIECDHGTSNTFLDVIFHNGKLYGIDTKSQVWVWNDLTSNSNVKVYHAPSTTEDGLSWRQNAYLVGSSSGKLLVVKHEYFHWEWVGVIELDGARLCQRKKITSLGDDAIFVGCIGSGMSIEVSGFPDVIKSDEIKSNYIYFANPRGIQKVSLEAKIKGFESFRCQGPLVWITF